MIYLISLVTFLIGIQLGLNLYTIQQKLNTLLKREPEPQSYVGTPLPPDYTKSSAGIAEPKSPAQIDFEEEQRINELR